MRRVLILVAIATALAAPAHAQRTYWRGTVAKLATNAFPHTHVELDSVVVDYVRTESDSDYHIRLRDPRDTVATHFVVAECIPLVPCPHPRVGDTITVRGIQRRDAEHGWAEVHPVELLTHAP